MEELNIKLILEKMMNEITSKNEKILNDFAEKLSALEEKNR